MDTINSMASSAAKMVWGETPATNDTTSESEPTGTENQKPLTDRTVNPVANNKKMSTDTSGQEPVSGKLGDTSKGEPFDAGNMEPTQAQTPGLDSNKEPSSKTSGLTGEHKPGLTGEHKTSGLGAHNTSGVSDTHTTPATSETSGLSGAHNTSGVSGSHNTAPSTETARDTVGTKGPTNEYLSNTGDQGGFKAAQADVRDPDNSATTDPKVEAQRKNVDDTGGLDEGTNPAKADGPGPKPLEEVARERGGDAANTGENKKNDDDPEGLGGHSESKGTGEQWVKTSGLKADGGDFDATKPGAGREADRILEEKGIVNPATAAGASKKTDPTEGSPTSPESGKKEKSSLKDKIKAKLHKN